MLQIEIHIRGSIGPEITDWFQGVSIHPISPDESCLCCEVDDNSAVYGLLSTLSSLGLTLISVFISDHDGVHPIPPSSYKENW